MYIRCLLLLQKQIFRAGFFWYQLILAQVKPKNAFINCLNLTFDLKCYYPYETDCSKIFKINKKFNHLKRKKTTENFIFQQKLIINNFWSFLKTVTAYFGTTVSRELGDVVECFFFDCDSDSDCSKRAVLKWKVSSEKTQPLSSSAECWNSF